VGLGLIPLLLLIQDPDKGYPDARGAATTYTFIFTVLLPIWVPFVRRSYRVFPRSPVEGLRAIWAVFAPIAATFVLVESVGLPIGFMFDSNGNDRLLAFIVALVGAALIVILTWHVAVDSDSVPPWEPGGGPPPTKEGALSD